MAPVGKLEWVEVAQGCGLELKACVLEAVKLFLSVVDVGYETIISKGVFV